MGQALETTSHTVGPQPPAEGTTQGLCSIPRPMPFAFCLVPVGGLARGLRNKHCCRRRRNTAFVPFEACAQGCFLCAESGDLGDANSHLASRALNLGYRCPCKWLILCFLYLGKSGFLFAISGCFHSLNSRLAIMVVVKIILESFRISVVSDFIRGNEKLLHTHTPVHVINPSEPKELM